MIYDCLCLQDTGDSEHNLEYPWLDHVPATCVSTYIISLCRTFDINHIACDMSSALVKARGQVVKRGLLGSPWVATWLWGILLHILTSEGGL